MQFLRFFFSIKTSGIRFVVSWSLRWMLCVNFFLYKPLKYDLKKEFYGPFLWMGFNCLKARATSRRQEIQSNLSNGKMKLFKFICWVLDFSLFSTSSHQRYSIKKVFLKISQNSQESTCTRVFLRQVFCCEFCKVFKNTFFTEHF